MPRQLGDIISSLRNENTSALEYEYNRRWIEQDLIRDIYDSYWRVSNLRTVADRYAAQRNKLISEHHQRINNLKANNREKMEQLIAAHRLEVQMRDRGVFGVTAEIQLNTFQNLPKNHFYSKTVAVHDVLIQALQR